MNRYEIYNSHGDYNLDVSLHEEGEWVKYEDAMTLIEKIEKYRTIANNRVHNKDCEIIELKKFKVSLQQEIVRLKLLMENLDE